MNTAVLGFGRGGFWQGRRQFLLPGFVIAITLLLILLPLGLMLLFSFRDGTPWNPGELTLDNYVDAYTDDDTLVVFGNTLVLGVASTIISMAVAIVFAFLTERTDLPYRNVAWGLMLVPIAMPGLLFAVAWTILLSPRIGIFNVWLREFAGLFGFEPTEGPFNIYTMTGMIVLEGLRGVTTAFLIIVGAFRAMDPSLEEAARTSGASSATTFFRVSLPVLTPALLAATMYSFMTHLESLEIPIVLGLPARVYVFPTYIYFTTQRYTPPEYGLAAALGATFLVISIILVYWYRRIVGQSNRFATVTGKGYRPRVIPLGRWRIPLFILFCVFFMLTIGAPALALLWSSFLPIPMAPSWDLIDSLTLRNYTRVLADKAVWGALWNTVLISVGAATLTMALAVTTAWVVVRLKSRWAGVLDAVAFLPHSLPGIVIGISLIFLVIQPPFDQLQLYGSLTVVILGLTISYLSFGCRMMSAALSQIQSELEEAATASGAKWRVTMQRIVLPLLLPGLVGGWIWVVTHALRNFSIPLLLSSRENKVISVLMWHTWDDGAPGKTAAIGVGLILALGIFTVGGRWLVSRLGRQQES
ncbi:MAG: iron ABC transporter permease [Rhodospirillaceae bacterium]|nr:iron ABC transporter permease [Rhodospirillaceae bacterium]